MMKWQVLLYMRSKNVSSWSSTLPDILRDDGVLQDDGTILVGDPTASVHLPSHAEYKDHVSSLLPDFLCRSHCKQPRCVDHEPTWKTLAFRVLLAVQSREGRRVKTVTAKTTHQIRRSRWGAEAPRRRVYPRTFHLAIFTPIGCASSGFVYNCTLAVNFDICWSRICRPMDTFCKYSASFPWLRPHNLSFLLAFYKRRRQVILIGPSGADIFASQFFIIDATQIGLPPRGNGRRLTKVLLWISAEKPVHLVLVSSGFVFFTIFVSC